MTPYDQEPIPVALVCSALHSLGGMCNHLMHIYLHLDRRRFHPKIFVHSRVPDLIRDHYLHHGVAEEDLFFLPCSGRRLFFDFIHSLSEYFHQQQIQIAHSFFLHSDILTFCSARRAKVSKLISSVEGKFILDQTNGVSLPKQLVYRFLNAWVRPRFDVTITVSKALADEVRRASFSCGNVEVISIGIPVPDKTYPPRMNSKDPVTVGFMGRFSPDKGVLLFLEMAKHLASRRKDVCFVIAGDGEERTKVERFMENPLLKGRIQYIGWMEDKETFYRMIDIFVMSSRREGCPLGLLEAMAYEKTVVAFDVDGVNEVIEPGINGLLVEAFDTRKMVDVLQDVVDKPSYSRQLAVIARQTVQEKYSIDCEMVKMQKCYEELMQERYTKSS